MNVTSRIQIDNRPTLDLCTVIYIESSLQGHSRLVVEVADYEMDDGESANTQGIDLNFDEMTELSGEILEYHKGKKSNFSLVPALQMHEGTHRLALCPGMEGMLSLVVEYVDDPDAESNKSVTVLLSRREALPIALSLKASAEIRQIADMNIQNEKDIGIDG